MDNKRYKSKKLNCPLSGEIVIPPDKSISHRALIFAALCKGIVEIKNLSLGADCISTLKIFEKLGVEYKFKSKRNLIQDSSHGLSAKRGTVFDCGNSGTTTRLLCGLFSRLNLSCTLVGDESLSKRPMKRVIEPLSLMGAKIESNNYKLPLKIKGAHLKGITYQTPVSSAQVKSALALAGLGADGETVIYEDNLSRNHSEIMLEYLGANIEVGRDENGFYTKIKKSKLTPKTIEITGDISSAAFFMVGAAIIKDSSIIIKNVGINPTRTGILDVFEQAKVNFELLNKRSISGEKVADIKVEYTPHIEPFVIQKDLVPRLIDEIPVLSILATQASGVSFVKDAADLRNKESDRIKTIAEALTSAGVNIKERQDGFEIEGKKEINTPLNLETYLDHRLAMSYYVLSLINNCETIINGFDCINTSFPEFLELFSELLGLQDIH